MLEMTSSMINRTDRFCSLPIWSRSFSGFSGLQPLEHNFKISKLKAAAGLQIKRRSSFTIKSSIVPGVSQIEAENYRLPSTQFNQDEKEACRKQSERLVETIRHMLRSMDDGNISVSAYDTAWVAMVPSLDGSQKPQFPECLDWIVDNQISDGSWGEPDVFLSFDRICSTMACIVSLSRWNLDNAKIEKGRSFIDRSMEAMEGDDITHLPIGFEIVFPALLDEAKALNIKIAYDAPVVKRIQALKEKKLKRISLDMMHETPTTLLHSLEGLSQHVNWKKILKLQAKNGSFLNSPASTACVLMHTGDLKCEKYLSSILKKFGNAVPNVYPVDLFERLWVVDRLERLGISRYFKQEIKDALDYVYRYWTPKGIGWGRETSVQDVDDTAMAFRLLRLHGYEVCADVFDHYKKEGEFFAFDGQMCQATTGMLQLYRASQLQFPEEIILHEAKIYSRKCLERSRHTDHEICDKWVMMKDLVGEVKFALDYPWCATLQRIEAKHYMHLYGTHDLWIGKSIYRMSMINNEFFLDLAKFDFHLCQSNFQEELQTIYRWNKEMQFSKLQFSRQKALECFFSAAATSFEPEMTTMRLVWARCCVLTTILDDYFDSGAPLSDLKKFVDAVKRWNPSTIDNFSEEMRILFYGLYNTTNNIIQQAMHCQGRNISTHLHEIWTRLLESFLQEAQWTQSSYQPTMQEYMNVAQISIALEPIVLTSTYFVHENVASDVTTHQDYDKVMQLLSICGRLLNDIRGFERESNEGKPCSVSIYMRDYNITKEEAIWRIQSKIEHTMQQLVFEVLRPTKVPRACKNIHLNMAKVLHFFYAHDDGYSSKTSIENYVNSILFYPLD